MIPDVTPLRVKTISEIHKLFGFPKPPHELISILDLDGLKNPYGLYAIDFYMIVLNRSCVSVIDYGQECYKVEKGNIYFFAPGQVFGRLTDCEEISEDMSGWVFYLHPDFLLKTSLSKNIKRFGYFRYAANNGLALEKAEDSIITALINNIRSEYSAGMDLYSKDIVVSLIEALLNYAERYYNRQFISQKIENRKILERLEDVLADYVKGGTSGKSGLPTVQYIAEVLNLSPDYLSSVLKALTGRNLQQQIQDMIIEQAKIKISSSDLSVNEIAYELGFEYPQSFSRLFKAKTGCSPNKFRQRLH
jgi:AraC family transcriptional activator of pobA